MNIFGQNYEEIGSSSKGLILKSSGKIKIQWGKKFIDLIDSNGNINSKIKNLIKPISSSEEINQDGFYYLENGIIAKVGDNVINLSSDSGTSISYAQEQNLTNEEKSTALKNIGFIYESQSSDNVYPTNGIVYILDEQKLYSVKEGQLIDYENSKDSEENKKVYSENGVNIYKNESQHDFYIGETKVFSITLNGIEGRGFKIREENGEYVLTVDKIDSQDYDLFDAIMCQHINDELTVSTYSISTGKAEGYTKITVNSNTVWKAIYRESYVDGPDRGIGREEIAIEWDENTGSQRTCSILIKDIFYNRLLDLIPDNNPDKENILNKHYKTITFTQSSN